MMQYGKDVDYTVFLDNKKLPYVVEGGIWPDEQATEIRK